MGPDAKKRIPSRVLRDVARRPVVETGASVPGYSGCAERLSERLFGMGPDAKKRFRSHYLEGCGTKAKCVNRGRRTRPAGSKLPCRALIRLRRLAALKGHSDGNVVFDKLQRSRAIELGHPAAGRYSPHPVT
jgi:hypothetical protein